MDKRACVKLRAPTLPPEWAGAASRAKPRRAAKEGEIASLMDRPGRMPEFRRKQAPGFPLAGLLALIAMAVFSGATKGYDDLAEYAATPMPPSPWACFAG